MPSDKVLVATDKEFFYHEVSTGVTPENTNYYNLMDNVAQNISLLAKDVIEIGAGMGTLGECLLKRNCSYYGIEPNIYHRQFALNRNVELHDLGDYPSKCDLIATIEVFEHLTDRQINDYMSSIEARYLYFSSTPYHTTPEFDAWWGHINIKQEEEWISLFSKFGYKLIAKPMMPTEWTLVFEHETI
jgi:cyclopropane fatty-acyl-phospholipid synthase-like methyltransferase